MMLGRASLTALSIIALVACDRRCADLHAAVAAGDRARFEQLSGTGDVTCPDRDDWTLLHVAARAGHVDLVTLLLERGADIEARGDVGRTPLYEAAKYGQAEIVRFLVERGANVDAASDQGFTPMMVGAERGHLGILEYLLDRGASIGAVNEVGKTALHQYVDHTQADDDAIPRFLVQRGVPLEVHDVVGATALYSAAQRGRARIAAALLEAGANPNATARRGHTPLDVAQHQGHEAVVALLTRHGGRGGGSSVYSSAPGPLPAQVTRTGVVAASTGPGAVPVGTRCTITARPVEGGRFNCQLNAICGGRRLYGGGRIGFTMCTVTPNGARAFDPFGTPDDDDPSAELDTERGVFIADDALPGTEGTSVRVSLDAPAP